MPFLYAPVAQLDRVLDYESSGWRFESSRVHHCYICHFNIEIAIKVKNYNRYKQFSHGIIRFKNARMV